jgi:hypothetical protein
LCTREHARYMPSPSGNHAVGDAVSMLSRTPSLKHAQSRQYTPCTYPARFDPIGTPIAYHVAYKSRLGHAAHFIPPSPIRIANPTRMRRPHVRPHTAPVPNGHRPGAFCTKPATSTHADIEANHATHTDTLR